MKNKIASYIILVLYITFSVGVVIEEHNNCNVCTDSSCQLNLNNNHKQSENCCNTGFCKEQKHVQENNCTCKFEQFRIKADYTSENKIKITSTNVIILSFINTFINNEQITQKNNSLFYIKLPDKKLFYKLSIYQISSILC